MNGMKKAVNRINDLANKSITESRSTGSPFAMCKTDAYVLCLQIIEQETGKSISEIIKG
ncbi:hypothetical protein [Brevibacillus laterosporus]|uniref:hypothetical protein n=1 Tax=Brevibacillus laterosporus TaxID=1465 RepID=UPI002E1A3C45|nr:hypothetical protein [Brevibacillus laterosporus]MED1667245.1 hypothetical protein [Brevibacillus laterosporus]MED1719687.1 hypothetical protein [Brevibacillus laterosporus]